MYAVQSTTVGNPTVMGRGQQWQKPHQEITVCDNVRHQPSLLNL